jgi:hypothetical protein
MCGQRPITITQEVLFICIIFELDRWPTGKPETGYKDTDSRPTKMEVIASDHNFFEYKMTMEKSLLKSYMISTTIQNTLITSVMIRNARL